ncbi:MAG: hypothetical protein ACM3Q9_01955 [Methanosarcina sp.]
MDEMTQMMLSRIAAGPGGGPELSIADVVERSLAEDPIAEPLAAALRQREAAMAAAADEVDADEALDPQVADVLERLYAEVEELRRRNRMFADALGACPRCFGEDQQCPVCRGRGRPGGREPDSLLMSELVEPAMRRAGGSSPAPDTPGEEQTQ